MYNISNDILTYKTYISVGIIQAPDVYYPSYMSGLWNTTSAGTGFTAPLGEALFGGPSSIRAAQRDMNETLVYPSQFSPLSDGSGRVIADRLFNVKSIAVASMGEGAVIDESQPDTNPARRLHLGLAPSKDVGNLFDIDLIAVSRQFRPSAGNTHSHIPSCTSSLQQYIHSHTFANMPFQHWTTFSSPSPSLPHFQRTSKISKC